ncbi:DNA-directed RNA polymerase subunit beta [Mycoavidus cysteinexigens]|uniref:DNA-directed RNA polymerase subunit beta n=2 Tax=Mycoavidus cysteinexigens TaxID=1553431 RepID=A0A2Z6EUR4_9BURK|nr:hypothetical protein [Mycoavidus cysteinexigens]BBE09136.1 DNA-directed RNA polymerase subunit beta [Mycoavidus cysteinexigens]GLR00200.1 hypothetical protein GCM10007934_00110 [Mycoavidus cysteinexigens]
MSAFQAVSCAGTRATVRPLRDITRELDKVLQGLSSEKVTPGKMTTAEHLERIARDLNQSLMTPVGVCASKTLSLMARLTHLVEQIEEKIKSGAEMEAEQSILAEMAADTVQLQRKINDERLATPLSSTEDLNILDGFNGEANKIRGTIKHLQESIELVQDNAALIEKNQALKQKISELKNNALARA